MLLTQLAKQGCGAGRVFTCTLRYWTKPSDLEELTKAQDRNTRRELRNRMRTAQSPEERAAIMAMQKRADVAYDCRKKGVAHCTESLIWLEQYIFAVTRRRPTPGALALLVEATAEALGLWPFDVEVASLRRELSRFKANNADYMSLLPQHVFASITQS